MAIKRLLFALAVLLPLPAGATVQVNGVGQAHATIAQALAVANPGDTLHVGAGTYNESVVVNVDITILGIGNVTWNGAGTALEVIRVANGVDLTLDNLKIRGGGSTNRRAILADGTNAIVLDTVDIDTDSTANGGVLYAIDPVSITVQNTTLAGSSTLKGGAIYAFSTGVAFPVSIVDTRFNTSQAGGDGGAIWTQNANVDCTRCTFEKTSGSQGGAIYTTGGQLTLEQSLVCDTTGVVGGAIYSSSTTTIRATRFVETTSGNQGGAINITGGTWILENNHFLGVASGALFGAVDLGGGATTFRNNLFYGNTTKDINQLSGSSFAEYNWLSGTSSGVTLNGTNITGTDAAAPDLVAWIINGNCNDDSLWPTPIDSPLIDAGDPDMDDPDGTPSDIGAYGGVSADPAYHVDADADSGPFFHDCDDVDPARYEANVEICDNIDNDCNDIPDDNPIDIDRFYPDCDGDGQGSDDLATEVVACFEPIDPPACGGVWMSKAEDGDIAWLDCNDADPDAYYGADETCDPGDRNCDGDDDLGAVDAFTWYTDTDGDLFGGEAIQSCDSAPPEDAVALGGDCRDDDSNINPDAADPCGDGEDTDCNGGDGDDTSILAWYIDSDTDGYGDLNASPVLDCADLSPAYTLLEDALDCDDGDAAVNPDALEICNEIDDDCNIQIDDAPDVAFWFPDSDGDGYGYEPQALETACPPEGFITVGGDCNDANQDIHPDAPETCNDVDDDCDDLRDAEDDDAQGVELVWEDWDQDGFGSCAEDDPICAPFAICPEDRTESHADNPDDCDDTNPKYNPDAAEIAGNEFDEDCDGQYDAGDSPVKPDGCNCASTPSAAGVAAPLLSLMLLSLRRRRK